MADHSNAGKDECKGLHEITQGHLKVVRTS